MRRLWYFGMLLLLSTAPAWADCWPGYRWHSVSIAPAPPLDYTAQMVYDTRREEAVLFSSRGETWTGNDTAWTRKSPTHSPQVGGWFHMAFDVSRGLTVLLHPSWDPVSRTDSLALWEWDGMDWNNVPQTGLWPRGFRGFAVAFDSRRGKLVLFGGETYVVSDYQWFDETWEYDGAVRQWALRSTSGPGSRIPGGMVFDATRGVTMLAAGWYAPSGGTSQRYDDTWTWDGFTWTQHPARLPSGPVNVVSLVYDEFHKVVWAFGAGVYGQFYSAVTWAWDGTDYHCRPGNFLDGVCTNTVLGSPPSLLLAGASEVPQAAPAAYDPRLRRVTALIPDRVRYLVRGNLQPVNFIDWRNPTPPGDGTASDPFLTVREALPCLTDGSTLFIQGGTYNEVEPITFNRRVDLIPLGGSVTIR
jgi:hypothetical protein